MKSSSSDQLFKEIDDTFININSFVGLPQLAKTYFAQFLVVYISGVYEEVVESTILEMANRAQNTELSNLIQNLIAREFQNPKSEKIGNLIKKFGNKQWDDDYKAISLLSKTALDSIVENKNALAHGQSSLNLTISDVENYYIQSKPLFEKLDDMLL